MPVQGVTFREAFCRYFNCPVEQFEEEALWSCFYPHGCLLAKGIYRLWPAFFRTDVQIIQALGWTRSLREVQSEASFVRSAYDKHRLRRDFFFFRISGQGMVSLAGCFMNDDSADNRFYYRGDLPDGQLEENELMPAEPPSKTS